MKRSVALSLALFIPFASGSAAGEYNMSSSCEYRNGTMQCSSYDSFGSGGRRGGGAQKLTPKEIAEREAWEQKWVAFCHPRQQIDDYGVTRFIYKNKGCEFGRVE